MVQSGGPAGSRSSASTPRWIFGIDLVVHPFLDPFDHFVRAEIFVRFDERVDSAREYTRFPELSSFPRPHCACDITL